MSSFVSFLARYCVVGVLGAATVLFGTRYVNMRYAEANKPPPRVETPAEKKARYRRLRIEDLQTDIKKYKETIANTSFIESPYKANYDKALQQYKEFKTKTQEARKKFDGATGGERMELADKLRELKVKEEELKRILSEYRIIHQTWLQGNPEESKKARKVAECKEALEKALQELRALESESAVEDAAIETDAGN